MARSGAGDQANVRRAAGEIARRLVASRTVILTASAAHASRMARFLADAGAHPVSVELGTMPAETRERFVALERSLAEPTVQTGRRFDEVDPDGTALVYAGSYTSADTVCGRRVIGRRLAAHVAAERKDTQRKLFGLKGDITQLEGALPHMTGPFVVQGIPDKGLAMAASHTYLIPRSANRRRTSDVIKTLSDCKTALISVFDAGIPCTFYGFVTASDVFDFGPVEALVYWNQRTWHLHAPGILRPLPLPQAVLAAAQAEVHTLAWRLHLETGYVGAFGTDGVITNAGYVIHEINPRVCAGFSLLDQIAPSSAPLAGVDLVLRESPDPASARLALPLSALASAVSSAPTPAWRLWEERDESMGALSEEEPHAEWAQRLRARVADSDNIHVSALI